jgi:hypothetical protein
MGLVESVGLIEGAPDPRSFSEGSVRTVSEALLEPETFSLGATLVPGTTIRPSMKTSMAVTLVLAAAAAG